MRFGLITFLFFAFGFIVAVASHVSLLLISVIGTASTEIIFESVIVSSCHTSDLVIIHPLIIGGSWVVSHCLSPVIFSLKYCSSIAMNSSHIS